MSEPLRRTGAAFTLLEMAVVLLIVAVLLSIGVGAFSTYQERTSARRAAVIFSYDLTMARSQALRSQEKVTVKFVESTRVYTITTASGRQLAERRFSSRSDINLSALDLALAGDSLVFSNRGVAQLSASVGIATFRVGTTTYQVRFNSMGAAIVSEL